MHHLVSNEQNGLIKGRYIVNNIPSMFDFIDYANCHDKQSTLLSLDMCKAFDSLKREFIFQVFKCNGFGDNFIRFLKTIYNTPKCCIINNNYMSSFFEVSTGVRQSDPLSPTIFVLSMQCFANVLMKDTVYTGVVIEQETLKFTMFADDILLFLSGTNDQFSRIFAILQEFFTHSNCKINLSKCQVFYIGSNRICVDSSFIDEG